MRAIIGVLLSAGLAGLLAVGAALGGSDPAASPSPEVSPSSPAPGAPERPSVIASPADTTVEHTLVMWGRGQIDADVAQGAAALPGVAATSFVRSGTSGLVASRHADGAPMEILADGYRIPVAVTAVDPQAHAATMPAGEARNRLAALQPGAVILSEAAARLRGLPVGGQVDLAGLPDLTVAAVVPDDAVGGSEFVIHADDADVLGLGEGGTLIVRYRGSGPSDVRELHRALRGLATDGDRVRIIDAAERRHDAPLVLSLPEVKARFGEFSYRPRAGEREIDLELAFIEEHIVGADVPILGTVRCHRAIVDDLRAALQEIVDLGLGHEIDPSAYGGCYYPRRISEDRDNLSRHSWGIAIDINVDLTMEGLGPPPPDAVVEAFEKHGFRWGGDFLHPDNHHFEWVGTEHAQRDPR